MSLKSFTSALAIVVAMFAVAGSISAQEHKHSDHQHGKHKHAAMPTGPHGGNVQKIGDQRIETVIAPKGIMFMILDAEGKAITPPAAGGTLKLRVGAGVKQYPYVLKPLKNNAIGVAVDLSKVSNHMLHLDVTLSGLAAGPVVFHAMGRVAEPELWICLMHPQVRRPTNTKRCPICSMELVRGLPDSELVKLQGTCPVSGKKLGSMGVPPKVVVDGRPLFVCCAGCSDRVKASPQQYIAKYYKTKGDEIRPGVFKSTLADANAIAAQRLCPVMDEPLNSMGGPLKVNVKGKAVYICCAGCAKKLNATPDEFLAKLDKMGVKPPAIK